MKNNSSTPRARMPRFRISPHARDRMRQYDVRDHHLLGAIGPVLDLAGHLLCPSAAADRSGELLHEPTPGSPVLVGRCFPSRRYCRTSGTRSVLLCTTAAGRRLHVVCVPKPDGVLDIVSLWDPDSEENCGRWLPHAQLPTVAGDLDGVPTRWCLGRPGRGRRFRCQG